MRYALSVIEAAKSLGVSPNTVRNMVNAGTLAHFRAGRRVLIPVVALEKLAGVEVVEPVNVEPAQGSSRRRYKYVQASEPDRTMPPKQAIAQERTIGVQQVTPPEGTSAIELTNVPD